MLFSKRSSVIQFIIRNVLSRNSRDLMEELCIIVDNAVKSSATTDLIILREAIISSLLLSIISLYYNTNSMLLPI